MSYKNENKSICNDWIIRLGSNDFLFNFQNQFISCGALKNIVIYVINEVEAYFTPPCYINLSHIKNEDDCIKILSHEFLHYILYKYFTINRSLDKLNNCCTKDLDNTGLGKYVGWGGVY